MNAQRVAVLGGDLREVRVASRLSALGHTVSCFGVPVQGEAGVRLCGSAAEAADGAQWVIGPSPGLGPDDEVFAPSAPEPIVLSTQLLSGSDVLGGGVILGRASSRLAAWGAETGCRFFEMKDDETLAAVVAEAVAEELVARAVGLTDRLLREVPVAVLGYGSTGRAIVRAFAALGARVSVAARRPEARAAAQANGARHTVPYEERASLFAESGLVVNTVPDVGAVPLDGFVAADPAGTAALVDISSPPGGFDHEAAKARGLRVIWARGLGGKRAPVTVGDAQFEFARRVIEAA